MPRLQRWNKIEVVVSTELEIPFIFACEHSFIIFSFLVIILS